MSNLDLSYRGFFSLPRGKQEVVDPALPDELKALARFGYGGRAMCLDSTGTGLWISGHEHADLVARVGIPEVGGSAPLREPFREVTPRYVQDEAKLDTLVGLAANDRHVCALWQEYYDVDGRDGLRVSYWCGGKMWMLGSGRIKETSGYLAEKNGRLYCGRSTGAGNAEIHRGPLLWKLESRNGGNGGTWTLVKVLGDLRPDWSPADDYVGVAFTDSHVVFLVSKAIGEVWYGGPISASGAADPFSNAKGYHTDMRQVWLLPYLHTAEKGYERQEPIILREFAPASACQSLVYRDLTNELLILEKWPQTKQGSIYPNESPRVHVYTEKLSDDEEPPEPPEEEEPDVLTIRVTNPKTGDVYVGDIEREDE